MNFKMKHKKRISIISRFCTAKLRMLNNQFTILEVSWILEATFNLT